jgi:hypothetical protein
MLMRLAQLSMLVSLYFTGRALYHTWGHGFSTEFFGQPIGPHMQFHAVREVFMALGLVVIIALFMYGPAALRNRISWIVMAIASAFLTAGVLIALPITSNTLPGFEAAMNHYGNTGFAALALALCWTEYWSAGQAHAPSPAGSAAAHTPAG